MDPRTPTWGTPGRLLVLTPSCGHPRSVRWAVADGVAAAAMAPALTTCPKKCPGYGDEPQPIISAAWAQTGATP